MLNEQKYIDFGLALVNGCHDTYNSTLTGIGPESFSWTVNGTAGVPAADLAFYERAGFYITDPVYVLRPEVLESFYYAYRVTGDQKYRDWAWNAFLAINGTTRVGSGYSEVENVDAVGGGGFLNVQDSFFLAEVLKYAYLIHAPVSPSTHSITEMKIHGIMLMRNRMRRGRQRIRERTSGCLIRRRICLRLRGHLYRRNCICV